MTYGQAIEELRKGKMLSRHGWNGKGLFVFMQMPSSVHKDFVPKMQSLPQAVKDEFQRRFEDKNEQIDAIYYSNQFAIVGKSNNINGWVASSSDTLAEDWFILE